MDAGLVHDPLLSDEAQSCGGDPTTFRYTLWRAIDVDAPLSVPGVSIRAERKGDPDVLAVQAL